MILSPTDSISFYSRIMERGADECWEWTGSVGHNGYGQPGTLSLRRIASTAHRLMFILINGPIEKHMKVCHKCDNPLCCNPNHLFLGTNRDNMLDCKSKGRTTKGQKDGMAKLTNQQAAEIRKLKGLTNKQIAAAYGVSEITASRVVRGVHY